MALTGAEKQARYKARHPERVKASQKKWREANKEYHKEWNSNNRDKRKEYDRCWKLRNRDKVYAKNAKRRASKLYATTGWADKKIISVKYWYAQWLSATVGVDYHVDHIVPLINDNVCGLHCEDNLQVITAKENLIKGNKYGS